MSENATPATAYDYTRCTWNLNNFPMARGSMLRHVGGELERYNGITAPWLYVGQLFATFCWHVEDHDLYSLNYLHHGAPKTW